MPPLRSAQPHRVGYLFFITLLAGSEMGTPVTPEDVIDWADTYATLVPVLGDPDGLIGAYVVTGYLPSFLMLNENLEVVNYGVSTEPRRVPRVNFHSRAIAWRWRRH